MEIESLPVKKTSETRHSRFRIIKNLCVISFSFVFLFTAYDGLSMLQSTMNNEAGVGTISQAVLYISFAISSMLLPKYVIKKLGCKMSIFFAVILYVPYVAANFSPQWFTLMPTAALLGIGASILWGAQCTYFNESAAIYCALEDEDKLEDSEYVAEPISNQTSYEVLSIADNVSVKSENFSVSTIPEDPSVKYCGCKSVIESSRRKSRVEMVEELSIKRIMEQYSKKSEAMHSGVSRKSSLDHHIALNIVSENLRNIEKSGFQESLKARQRKWSLQCENNQTATSDFRRNLTNGKRDSIISQISVIITDGLQNLKNDARVEDVTAWFFGCHGMLYYSAMIWSNLMTFYLLQNHGIKNATDSCACGADFCNAEFDCLKEDTEKVPDEMRYMLSGVCVVFGVIGAFLILFVLDPLEEEKQPVSLSLDHLLATYNQCKKKEQLFLIPISMFVGMSQGFYTADITKSYVDCAWGTSHVGLASIFYGLGCALSSTVSGYFVKHLGRILIFTMGYLLTLMNFALLLLWTPNPEEMYMFLLAAALWGASVGLFWSQVQALHGVLFKKDEEAAFASYYLFCSVGWTMSFSYSDYICTSTKIYILVATTCMGIIGYFIAERLFSLRKKQPPPT